MTRALIIGGGIAGTVTAIALREAGLEPVVHEAYGRTADGVGAFLSLAVNGLDALDAVGLKGPVWEQGFDTPDFAFYNGNGKRLGEIAGKSALPDGTVMRTVLRADLYRVLRDEAERRGIRVEYGKRLTGASGTGTGVRAEFADGSHAEGDLLVGADGLHSRVRGIIDPQAPGPHYLGLLNTGGHARGVTVDGRPGTAYMIFGKRCFFCYLPHPDGSVWWFANPPRRDEPGKAELDAITDERWRAELVRLAAVDKGPARAIIEASTHVYRPWPTYDFPSVPNWYRDRMIIIGDAAHATSPASGQGASMAMEDAVTLARCLRDLEGVPAAFARYEQLRRERVEAIVAQGRRNTTAKTPGPVGRLVRDFFIAKEFKKFTANPEDPQRWMWDHHIDWSTPVAA
ncbi:FAD-dependent oxidoreductase [Amycolatopsis aidingensis]|uniref:FAD-dependent oxidoreductase n=1 Tax=Amycolatopsis aidingensis TaxID=2842453 RepID=UPI001C0D48F3|nr:FAD-dependent monooxygenase [Amycolatopsis aidingensis]